MLVYVRVRWRGCSWQRVGKRGLQGPTSVTVVHLSRLGPAAGTDQDKGTGARTRTSRPWNASSALLAMPGACRHCSVVLYLQRLICLGPGAAPRIMRKRTTSGSRQAAQERRAMVAGALLTLEAEF